MKHLLLILSLLLFQVRAGATTDFTSFHYKGNSCVIVYSGGYHSRGVKMMIEPLLYYLDILNKSYFDDSVYIKVTIGLPDQYYGNGFYLQCPDYMLGYYKDVVFDAMRKREPDIIRTNAIVVHCHTQFVDIEEILQLVYFSMNNTTLLQTQQELYFIKDYYPYYIENGFWKNMKFRISEGKPWALGNWNLKGLYDFIYSLPQKQIDSILDMVVTNPISQILEYKAPISIYGSGKFGCFSQKDSVFLYRKRNNNIRLDFYDDYEEVQIRLNSNLDEILCSFKNVDLIIPYELDGCIISTDDTTFYQYSLKGKTLKGPFVVPSFDTEYFAERRLVEPAKVLNENTLVLNAENYAGGYQFHLDIKSGTVTLVDSSANFRVYSAIAEAKAQVEAEKEQVAIKERLKKEKQRNILILMSLVVIVNVLLATTKRL